MTFHAAVLTLYPEMFPGPLGVSLAGRALGRASGRSIRCRSVILPDKHRTVDDTPAGGGAGMVLRVDVLARAIDHAREMAERVEPSREASTSLRLVPLPDGGGPSRSSPCNGEGDRRRRRWWRAEAIPVIAMTPRGRPLTQARVRELAAGPG
jgi:tRNA (guanine37-N1)-methyltransferase